MTLLLAITTLFFILRMAPGDPVEKILGPEASREDVAKYTEQLGLSKPVLTQYYLFLEDIVQGDLGNSLFKNRSVKELLVDRMPPTIWLAFISIFFSFFIAFRATTSF